MTVRKLGFCRYRAGLAACPKMWQTFNKLIMNSTVISFRYAFLWVVLDYGRSYSSTETKFYLK